MIINRKIVIYYLLFYIQGPDEECGNHRGRCNENIGLFCTPCGYCGGCAHTDEVKCAKHDCLPKIIHTNMLY